MYNRKTIKICPNQHADLFRFLLLTEDSLITEKGLERIPRSHISYNFLIETFLM